MKELLAKLSKIGCLPTDDDFVVVKKQFLVYQGLGMSIAGFFWGVLLLVFNYPAQSIIPFGYGLITSINFTLLWKLKNFNVARIVQMTISVSLPFLLQWFLGLTSAYFIGDISQSSRYVHRCGYVYWPKPFLNNF